MLNREVAHQIVENIRLNHAFNAEVSVPFVTDQATGYVPRKHLDTYLECPDFRRVDGNLMFAEHVQGFDLKTAAMQKVTDSLLEKGILIKPDLPRVQERSVGGPNRIISPEHAEFKINRAYFRNYGFPSDAVFLNVVVDDPEAEGIKILLQQRSGRVEAANTFDFAAGGAVTFPDTLLSAFNNQTLRELGVDVSRPQYMGSTAFKFSTEEKEWVTNLQHNLFGLHTQGFTIGDFDTEDVQGFKLVSPEDVLEYSANEKIPRQNIQSMMTSMDALGLLPEFDGVDEIRQEIAKHYREPDPDVAASFEIS
jgi:hypothetical protein